MPATRTLSTAAAAAASVLLAAPAVADATPTTQVIVRTGQEVPGGGASFYDFRYRVINDAGQVAFLAFTGPFSGLSVYRADGTSLVPIARGEDMPPGQPALWPSVDVPSLNHSGLVAFRAYDVDSTPAIYVSDGSSPYRIPNSPLFADSPVLNDFGEVVLADSQGVYRASVTWSTAIVRAGDAAPVGPGQFYNFAPERRFSMGLNDAGEAAFVGSLQGIGVDASNDAGLYRGDGTSLVQVARKGDPVPVGPGVFTSFENPNRLGYLPLHLFAFNEAGQMAFIAGVGGTGVDDANDSGVYLGDGNAMVQIARAGDAVPGGPGVFDTLRDDAAGGSAAFDPAVFLNNAGQALFRADLTGPGVTDQNDAGLFRGDGTSLVPIVREGDAVPGSNQTIFDWIWSEAAINDAGQVLFRAGLENVATGDKSSGLFLYDDTLGLLTVARAGDAFEGSTLTGFIYTVDPAAGEARRGLNNHGQVVFEYELANGQGGIAVWSIPEPTGLAGLALAAGGLLRRRRA